MQNSFSFYLKADSWKHIAISVVAHKTRQLSLISILRKVKTPTTIKDSYFTDGWSLVHPISTPKQTKFPAAAVIPRKIWTHKQIHQEAMRLKLQGLTMCGGLF